MAIPDNLKSLHIEEERIRSESLASIERTERLGDHLSVVHASMAVILAIAQGHEHRTNEEKVIQYLGLRIFNDCASALKLGLSGYYQSAFAVIRDIFETALLLDYFRTFPDKISEWEGSDRRTRLKDFAPFVIRKALDERDGYTEQKRKKIYDQLSEYASHATAPGFVLVAPEGLGKLGPFFHEKYIRAVVEEMVKYAAQSALVFIGFFQNLDESLDLEKAHFLKVVDPWQERCLSGEKPSAT